VFHGLSFCFLAAVTQAACGSIQAGPPRSGRTAWVRLAARVRQRHRDRDRQRHLHHGQRHSELTEFVDAILDRDVGVAACCRAKARD
jgi:hypothetical protein